MRTFVPGMCERGWGRVVNFASMAGKDGNTCRGLRLVANAWRLYRQAVLPPALPRRAVILALISDADWVRDESGRKVLDASGVEGRIEDLSFDADEIGWGVGPATHQVQGDPVRPLPVLPGHAPPRRVRRPGSEHDHRPLP